MRFLFLLLLCGAIACPLFSQTKSAPKSDPFARYISNRAPLRANPYIELPLGAIQARGWLKEMLIRQKNGATGQLDVLYPQVMGARNGWLGGDGDQWERGPYWVDGLLPLAYLLNDKELIAKVKPWVEWSLNNQQPNGYFGPLKDYPYEPGIQRDNCQDWWPKMVMLKILKQYYSAAGDQRVLKLMTNYFKYQLQELPKHPLDHWTFWARFRSGDNMMVVYWLYNQTGDAFLLELADLIHKQSFDFTNGFLNTDFLSRQGSVHCVNLAQGLKEPIVYYQQHPEERYLKALEKGMDDIRRFNGMAHGLYGGDEALHGNNPTQGSELCSAVEMMFSLESMLNITGNLRYADQLEKIAFNALPTQISDDFTTRQYFQQANQVMLTRHMRNFDINHGGTDVCYGLLSGFACCTSNMHQGWPKFTQNLWYATPDKGMAALVYSPSEADVIVANGTKVHVIEETNYPFRDTIRFAMNLDKKVKSVAFPFHLRIPSWCKKATIAINGSVWKEAEGNQVVVVNREWKPGDRLDLVLPMHLFKNEWYENSVSIERGPLVYALKMNENWKSVQNDKDPIDYGNQYWEVKSDTPWNYGLTDVSKEALEKNVKVIVKNTTSTYPWNLAQAPIELKLKARLIPSWQLYNDMTGPIPYSVTYKLEMDSKEEEITLIPYGCTTLRISQFPVAEKRE